MTVKEASHKWRHSVRVHFTKCPDRKGSVVAKGWGGWGGEQLLVGVSLGNDKNVLELNSRDISVTL